jgi:class 3 adenylate cyclase
MPEWNKVYYDSLVERFTALTDGIDDRLGDVKDGRVAPALDDLAIGSARSLTAAVLFFDIRDFRSRVKSDDGDDMKRALHMLDCVIPMAMHVVYDFGGYVEKNTGDGIMAVVGAEESSEKCANDALSIATTLFYSIEHIVNPHLVGEGIAPVQARIGIDAGTLLISRIGVATGSAKHPRSFLTVVGPTANNARAVQEMAGTDETWVGDLVKAHASVKSQPFFLDKTPAEWHWVHLKTGLPYRVWHFNAVRTEPL